MSRPPSTSRATHLLAAVAVGSAAAMAGATAAWAHATLDKSSVPADSDQRLTLRVPVERFDPPATRNVKVVVEVPAAFTLESCRPKLGWRCSIQRTGGPGRALATWERDSGFDAIDLFEFDVHTPRYGGRFAFEVNQHYSTGEVVCWDGPEGSDHPAPVLEVTGPNEPPRGNNAPPGSHDHQPPPTSPPSPTTAGSPPTTTRASHDTTTTKPVPAPASFDGEASVAHSTSVAEGARPAAPVTPTTDPPPSNARLGGDSAWVVTAVLILAVLAVAVVAAGRGRLLKRQPRA
jgi:uncharacterized protein YcnI